MKYKTKLTFGIFILFLNFFLFYNKNYNKNYKTGVATKYTDNLLKVVDKRAQNKVIILCIIDLSFVDMAINFYKSSIRPHNIKNYLFCTSSLEACNVLSQHSIACAQYTEITISEEASSFFSSEFKEKMDQRLIVILDVIKAGYTVVHTDADLYFFKNPVPYLEEVASKNDIGAMWDKNNYNAGFLVIRPSKHSIHVYESLIERANENQLNDQINLNVVIKEIKSSLLDKFTVHKLNIKKFLCGYYYFDHDKRYFPKPCPECIVVHNNFIISKEAKIYRFKEHHMWLNDHDQYYSSPYTKYMTFTILDFNHQLETLATALVIGRILDRKVILPRFSKNSIEYPLHHFLCMTSFDEFFKDSYRESSFLTHPLVPGDLKQPHLVKNILMINQSKLKLEAFKNDSKTDSVLYHMNSSGLNNICEQEIIENFGNLTNRIIHFTNLIVLNVSFSKSSENSVFQMDIKKGFKNCNSLQKPL